MTKEEQLMKEFFKWKENQVRTDQLFEMITMLNTRIETINERTKKHTLEIKQLEKKLK